MNRTAIFDAVRRLRDGADFTPGEVKGLDAAIDASLKPTIAPPSVDSGLTSRKAPLAAIIGVVAATSLFATIPKHEGVEHKAYRDIVGVWTICAGDTKNVRAGMVETPEGCRQRLESQLIAHAKPVMACTPSLSAPGRDYQRAAAVSLAYNVGVGGWCRSTADKLFDAGDWRRGCDAFLRWNMAGGRVVRGLTIRRQEERALCLKGLT